MSTEPTVPGTGRGLRCGAFREARGESSGFTVVETVVSMALMLLVMAFLPSIIVTTTTATSSAEGTAAGAAQAQLAIQNLDAQVASASQVCLPTQLTNPSSGTPLTVSAGFALRVEQVESSDDQPMGTVAGEHKLGPSARREVHARIARGELGDGRPDHLQHDGRALHRSRQPLPARPRRS